MEKKNEFYDEIYFFTHFCPWKYIGTLYGDIHQYTVKPQNG